MKKLQKLKYSYSIQFKEDGASNKTSFKFEHFEKALLLKDTTEECIKNLLY